MGKGKLRRKTRVLTVSVPRAIAQALKELDTFPDIVQVGEPTKSKKGWTIVALFKVPLPTRVMEVGESSTGVRAIETVFMVFPENYPCSAPRFFLRKDFPRDLPHINPGSKDSLVSPCIYDGSLDDLLHQGLGLTELIYQMQMWLKKAAGNTLIDPKQGWEPIRFDDVDSLIVYDRGKISSMVSNEAGFKLLTCELFTLSLGTASKILDYSPRVMDSNYVHEVTQKDFVRGEYALGIRPVLLCWPDESTVVNAYFPETVTNLGELLEKSKKYGTYGAFWEQIQLLWNQSRKMSHAVEVVTIHCVRRPLKLINQNSSLEFLSYRVKVQFTGLGPDENSPVDIICHRHAVGPDLLRQMSGASPGKMEGIVQIGCGSLGSKIALHLCRAGHGPFTLIDNSYMSDHNLARHALTTATGNKAELLKKEMDHFNILARVYPKSLQEFLSRSSGRLFEKANLIIDSTASINVRETLASLPNATNESRIFQTGLYSYGKLGFISVEGSARNPRVDDLSAAIFDLAIENKVLAGVLAESEDTFHRHSTGQGCGSYTTIIPDTRISLHTAAMAERARQIYEGDIPEIGEVSLGFLTDAGMSLQWQTFSVGRTTRVPLGNKDWELRVLSPALEAMEKDVASWPGVETGGILVGRLSLARKCAIITRVLEAPPDSIRTSARFELGTEGLVSRVAGIQRSSGLTYLGTWHSHLHGSTPSGIDEATLKKIKKLRLGIPAFNLIWHNKILTCFADYGDY
jgi:hypothetical protein